MQNANPEQYSAVMKRELILLAVLMPLRKTGMSVMDTVMFKTSEKYDSD